MNYYKYDEIEDHPLGGGITYIESEDGWALRQITVRGDRYFASNMNNPPWGLVLADARLDYESLGHVVTAISASEFEAIWQAHLRQHHDEWEARKKAYPIGTTVAGTICIFFPQGVIVDLANNALAVADYRSCLASAPRTWIPGVGYGLTAVVGGYDETNQWLILDAPRVHTEAREI